MKDLRECAYIMQSIEESMGQVKAQIEAHTEKFRAKGKHIYLPAKYIFVDMLYCNTI